MKKSLHDLWNRINPSDPSPGYLLKFMAFNITAMSIALMIGRLT